VELRRLGASGLRVSTLSLGAMTFGAGAQTLMKGVTSSEEEARRVFDRVLEAQRYQRTAQLLVAMRGGWWNTRLDAADDSAD